MKKVFGITVFLLLMVVSLVGVTYSYEYPDSQAITWKLLGEENVVLDIGNKYIEYGVMAYRGDEEVTDLVFIDESNVNVNKVGEYKVKYSFVDNDGIMEYIYRRVVVIDKGAPVIVLNGKKEMTLSLGEKYIEPGYIIKDDKDKDLVATIEGVVDENKAGEYILKYIVTDSDSKSSMEERHIIVK